MRGRKPDPVKMREARVHLMSNTPLPRTLPQCPTWLDDEAKVEWDRVVPELAASGVIGALDMMALATYCQTFATWKQCELQVRREGILVDAQMGGQKVHPLAKHARDLIGELRRLAAELGFTPAARSRLRVPPKASTEGDDFDAFVGGARLAAVGEE
jgi:P27 family predicted phage terminase small subunit